jgi:hypothetical protein
MQQNDNTSATKKIKNILFNKFIYILSPNDGKNILVIFVLSSFWCAAVSEEQKNTLGVVAAKCLLDAVEKNDDGIGPADTVAVGLISSCQKEIDAYDEARVPEKYTYFGEAFWANRMTGWMKQSTTFVLQARVGKRK